MSAFCEQHISETIAYSLTEHGEDYRLSEHFQLKEFASADGADIVLVHPVLITLLEALRLELGGYPLHINSGYRTHSHNAAIGGKPQSRHLFGMAADLSSKHVTSREIYEVAKRVGVGGLGLYLSFCHVDVWGKDRRWYG